MRPIDFIGVKNFRVFDDQDGMFEEFSSINLLTGTNNSGKSSIIKYLQMLKNSVAGAKIPFDLDLTQQEHLLGDFENVLYNANNNIIEISLPFTFLGISTIYSTFSFFIPSQSGNFKGHLRKLTINDKKDNAELFSFAYREATEEEKKLDEEEYTIKSQEYEREKNNLISQNANDLFLNQFSFAPTENPLFAYIDWKINIKKLKFYLTESLQFYEYYLLHKNDENFLSEADKILEDQNIIPSFLINSLKGNISVDVWKKFLEIDLESSTPLIGKEPLGEFDFQSEEYFWPDPQIEELLYHYSMRVLDKNLTLKNNTDLQGGDFFISECFKSCYKELTGRITTINYLSTIKEENSRIYIGTNNSTFTNLLKDYSALDIDTDFINRYLKEFEIGDEILVNYERKHQVISISIISKHSARDLVDFGYGIKQLILILMHISVIAEKNKKTKGIVTEHGDYEEKPYYIPSLLLIEEPETNLHPKWQSLLAEMFVVANSLYNIQLVIETHSEYLIRKFQTLTAQGAVKSKDVKIFYLRGANKIMPNRKQLETIFIEEDGTINYRLFDGGFFDEANNLELSLLNFQRDNFFKDFETLKEDNKDNENKINDLQQKIDDFTNKANIAVYQTLIDSTFADTSKLLPESLRYLSTGQYLYHNIDDNSDFSPVILQYGRSVENELGKFFRNISSIERWTIGIMQGSLEKYKFSTTALRTCSANQYLLLQSQLAAIFNTPTDLKIELVEDLRVKRNEAAHPGPIKTKAEALDYINNTNDFLKKWIELKK